MDSRDAPLKKFVIYCTLVAALGAGNSGVNTSALNIPGAFVRNCPNVAPGVQTYFSGSPMPQCLPMGDWVWGIVNGLFAIGGFIGAMANGYMINRFGRRDSMLLMNATFFVGAILLSVSVHAAMFAIGRMFVGIGCGFMTCAVGVYVSEIAPAKYRGALTSCLQLLTTMGILIIELIGLGLTSPVGWRVACVITIAPAIVQMILLPTVCRSPRWLISKNRIDEARVEFLKLRHGDVEAEFTDMLLGITKGGEEDKPAPENDKDSNGFDNNKEVGGGVTGESEEQLSLIKVMSIGVLASLCMKIFVVHALSQLTGINAIMYYSTTIFENSFGSTAQYVTVGVGALNVVITVVGLSLVDRLGRKILLLISTAGMCIFQVIMVIAMKYNVGALQVVCIMLYVASFAIGYGMIPFVLVSECFPTYAVGACSSACLAINWLCNFIIGLVFPAMLSGMGPYAFIIFAALAAVAFVFIFIFIPETKGKTLDELGRQLGWYGIDVAGELAKKGKH